MDSVASAAWIGEAFSKRRFRLMQEGKAVAIFPERGRTMTGAWKPKPGIGV